MCVRAHLCVFVNAEWGSVPHWLWYNRGTKLGTLRTVYCKSVCMSEKCVKFDPHRCFRFLFYYNTISILNSTQITHVWLILRVNLSLSWQHWNEGMNRNWCTFHWYTGIFPLYAIHEYDGIADWVWNTHVTYNEMSGVMQWVVRLARIHWVLYRREFESNL